MSLYLAAILANASVPPPFTNEKLPPSAVTVRPFSSVCARPYHDIAHHIDKARHEILSAEIFYKDEEMKRFFTEDERLIIKQAIEDHRASSDSYPRSDYGKIISSADRSTDIDDFLRRTHSYTLKHFPNCTNKEMLKRAHRVIILNPEKKIRWNNASSFVSEDEKIGAEVYEVSSLEKFEKIIAEL